MSIEHINNDGLSDEDRFQRNCLHLSDSLPSPPGRVTTQSTTSESLLHSTLPACKTPTCIVRYLLCKRRNLETSLLHTFPFLPKTPPEVPERRRTPPHFHLSPTDTTRYRHRNPWEGHELGVESMDEAENDRREETADLRSPGPTRGGTRLCGRGDD